MVERRERVKTVNTAAAGPKPSGGEAKG